MKAQKPTSIPTLKVTLSLSIDGKRVTRRTTLYDVSVEDLENLQDDINGWVNVAAGEAPSWKEKVSEPEE